MRILIVLLVLVLVASFLKFVFLSYDYIPSFYAPRDFERQKQLQREK